MAGSFLPGREPFRGVDDLVELEAFQPRQVRLEQAMHHLLQQEVDAIRALAAYFLSLWSAHRLPLQEAGRRGIYHHVITPMAFQQAKWPARGDGGAGEAIGAGSNLLPRSGRL